MPAHPSGPGVTLTTCSSPYSYTRTVSRVAPTHICWVSLTLHPILSCGHPVAPTTSSQQPVHTDGRISPLINQEPALARRNGRNPHPTGGGHRNPPPTGRAGVSPASAEGRKARSINGPRGAPTRHRKGSSLRERGFTGLYEARSLAPAKLRTCEAAALRGLPPSAIHSCAFRAQTNRRLGFFRHSGFDIRISGWP